MESTFVGKEAVFFSFTSSFFVNFKFHSAFGSEIGNNNKMSENAVTQVTGHFDTKLFPYKSFRCKFINSSCKSFHVLGYSPQMFFFCSRANYT